MREVLELVAGGAVRADGVKVVEGDEVCVVVVVWGWGEGVGTRGAHAPVGVLQQAPTSQTRSQARGEGTPALAQARSPCLAPCLSVNQTLKVVPLNNRWLIRLSSVWVTPAREQECLPFKKKK